LLVDDRDAVPVDNGVSSLQASQEVTTVDGPKVEVNNWIAAIYNEKWYPGVLSDNLIPVSFISMIKQFCIDLIIKAIKHKVGSFSHCYYFVYAVKWSYIALF